MLKKVPIGIEDYRNAQKYYYIDKTLLIKDLLDDCIGKSILITRPRRFGKNLNLSMLDNYFNIKYDSEELFNDKLIKTDFDDYSLYLNNYPVIRFNLKSAYSNDHESQMNSIMKEISSLFRNFPELINSKELFDIEKENFLSIANEKVKEYYLYSTSIRDLSSYLYKHYKKKVIILIDEYDQPIESAYEKGFYNETIDFFKSLFSSSLKGNDNCFFAVVTGVLEVNKESLFSGLNNLSTYSNFDNRFTEYFGFTESEIKELLRYYQLENNFDEVKKWYGGYGNKNIEIYNPWSVLNYIDKKSIGLYWVNTGTNELINNLINNLKNEGFNSKEFFSEYLNNENKKILFNPLISYKDLNNTIDSLLSFLVQTGYLVLKKDNDIYSHILIPNLEINQLFEKEIISSNIKNDSITKLLDFKNSIKENNVDKISSILKDYILSSFSYFDLTNEKEYQILIVGLLSILFDQYIVKSEVNNKYGRCDILIRPKNNKDIAIVIELKKYKGTLSSARLESKSLEALNQIIEKEYYQELKLENIKKIIIYSFVFDDKHNSIMSREI